MFEVSQILLPVADMESSLAFYADALGLPVALRDGDRYATLRAGGVKIALADPSQRAPGAGAATAFKVESVEAVAERLREAGHEVGEIVEGPHERSFEIADPDGHAIVFYAPL